MQVLVKCFSCTPDANVSEGFLLYSSGFVSVQTDLTAQSWHDLVRTSLFLFTLIVLFGEEFLLHSWGHDVLVRNFSYTPRAGFIWWFSLTLFQLVLLRSFSHASFSEVILSRSSCNFYSGLSLTDLMILLMMWGVSLTHLMLVLVRCLSWTPDATSAEVFLFLHSWYF